MNALQKRIEKLAAQVFAARCTQARFKSVEEEASKELRPLLKTGDKLTLGGLTIELSPVAGYNVPTYDVPAHEKILITPAKPAAT